jgi:purine-binding chemotaxis protein CheW
MEETVAEEMELTAAEDMEEDKEHLQLVTFGIGDEQFSVPILNVREIIRLTDITRVPNSPGFIEGVINLRGKVIPIIDMRTRFGLPSVERGNSARIIVVNSNGKVVGLVVDLVSEVMRLPASTIEPPPAILGGVESEYIEGVGKLEGRLIMLLNLDKVLL